jgi:hypothetical protein
MPRKTGRICGPFDPLRGSVSEGRTYPTFTLCSEALQNSVSYLALGSWEIPSLGKAAQLRFEQDVSPAFRCRPLGEGSSLEEVWGFPGDGPWDFLTWWAKSQRKQNGKKIGKCCPRSSVKVSRGGVSNNECRMSDDKVDSSSLELKLRPTDEVSRTSGNVYSYMCQMEVASPRNLFLCDKGHCMFLGTPCPDDMKWS